MVIPKLLFTSKVTISSTLIICLSSASTCALIAFTVSTYPNAAAASFPTNHDSPSFSIHLRSPNSGLLKISHWEVEEEGVIVVLWFLKTVGLTVWLIDLHRQIDSSAFYNYSILTYLFQTLHTSSLLQDRSRF